MDIIYYQNTVINLIEKYNDYDNECLIDLITGYILHHNKFINKDHLINIIKIIMLQNKKSKSPLDENDEIVDNAIDEKQLDFIKNANDFVNHKYDIDSSKFPDKSYDLKYERFLYLKNLPQPEQKSKEWFDLRNKLLSATNIAAVINEDKYEAPLDKFLDKLGKGKPFDVSEATHHGNRYEEIANMIYCYRNNINVEEFGLIVHDKYKFLGASPDGICNKKKFDGP